MRNPTGIQESHPPRACDWPHESVVYLTIDYECDYGTALKKNTFEALNETSWLVALLEDLDIPLTCFIQTEVLETKPEEVDRLRNSTQSVTFHPRSHTHKRREHTDVETELATATQR